MRENHFTTDFDIVATTRLAGGTFNSNGDASRVNPAHALITEAKNLIGKRAAEVEGSNASGDRVTAALNSRIDAWAARAQRMTGGATLGYKTKNDGKTFGLLQTPGSAPWQDFTCLNSLRDVEPTVNLILDNYGMDEALVTPAESAAPPPRPAAATDVEELLL